MRVALPTRVPCAVGNVVEILDLPPEDGEDDAAAMDVDAARRGKSVVVKTTMRQVGRAGRRRQDAFALRSLLAEVDKKQRPSPLWWCARWLG